MPSSATQENIEKAKGQLESIIDSVGLAYAIELMSVVCGEKADHLESNWQDYIAAKDWTKDGNRLSSVACKLLNQ